jgi:membrane protein
MSNMWSLGGLSVPELFKRTARECWEDYLFGQAAQLAFYHFLAIFPAFFLVLIPLSRVPSAGGHMRVLFTGSIRQLLPASAASLVGGTINDLNAHAHGTGVLLAIAAVSAIWGAVNAAWALVAGLNVAYETEEDRNWVDKSKVAVGLASAVVLLVFAALLTTYYAGGRMQSRSIPAVVPRAAQWIIVVGMLLILFGLFYRFGPNLKDRTWEWSTPGAVFGAGLWILSILLVRCILTLSRPHMNTFMAG